MAVSQWSPFAKFCKNEFRLFSERQVRRKKVKCHDGNFAMVTIREILQKLTSTFFWTSSKTKESALSFWRIRDGHHSRNFSKMEFDFFLSVKNDEKGAVTWRRIHNGHHSRNLAKMKYDFFLSAKNDEKRDSDMTANSQWPPFAKFFKNF